MGFLLARARVLQRKVLHLSCLRILSTWPAQPLEGTQNTPVGGNVEHACRGFCSLSSCACECRAGNVWFCPAFSRQES